MFDFLEDDPLNPLRPRAGQHEMIAGPGPQRTPAELGAIDVPEVGSGNRESGTSGNRSEAASPLMGSPVAPMPRSSDAPISSRSADIAGPSTSGSVAAPARSSASSPTNPIAGPSVDPLEQDRQKHQATLDYYRSTGSGISQIHNPFLRGLARVGDIAGSALFPFQTAMIPGTELHHRSLMRDETGAINQDLGEQKERADTAHTSAETEKIKNPPGSIKEEQLLYDKNGTPIGYRDEHGKFYSPEDLEKATDPNLQAVSRVISEARPKTAPVKGDETPLGDRVTQINERLKDRYQILNPGQPLPAHYTLPANATVGDYKTLDKDLGATESARGTKAQQDQTNAIRQEMLELAKQNQADRQQAALEKKNKPTPDEQKRADLARNMNENLDALEEIVDRRPDLFGPVAGRMTGWKAAAGSDDPDIGALQTINHMLGMVQQSTHGMRSAHGVEAAAQSITQGFHSQPAALKGAIAAARASIRTFTEDAQPGKGGGSGGGAEKVATSEHITAYAKQKGISEDKARKEFKEAGWSVK